MDFDVIPYDDIKGDWKKLGSGSFGNVYKSTYLGIDVAIKEVLPSNEYDVRKYFEREWRLMKEARHPNVVLYLGLSRAPPPDGRIFIISEFIESGNLRQYIYDKSKPFGWRLRLSFMTDIARALAYLHARKCIHRDLKGENLLVTSNLRLKVTDFGFARIAARNEEESKRLTFCGTDSYMSPEILIGEEFDLPTDIFSLGIIFCEIISRKLADDYTFKRTAPFFSLDEHQLRALAPASTPPDLINLAIECCNTNPTLRPSTVSILARLRAVELEVLARPDESEDQHVGSVKFMAGAKRPATGPRIPSFGMGVSASKNKSRVDPADLIDENVSDSDEELEAAIKGLEGVNLKANASNGAGSVTTSSWIAPADFKRGSRITHDTEAERPLIDLQEDDDGNFLEYSTTVIRGHSKGTSAAPTAASVLTMRPETIEQPFSGPTPVGQRLPPSADSLLSIDTYHTAKGLPSAMAPSIAAATEGSTMSAASATPSAHHHRFTLIKPGKDNKRSGSVSPTSGQGSESVTAVASNTSSPAWTPLDFFFFSGGLNAFSAKCDACGKRLGWKPILECDDCGLRPYQDPIELTGNESSLLTSNRNSMVHPNRNSMDSNRNVASTSRRNNPAFNSTNRRFSIM